MSKVERFRAGGCQKLKNGNLYMNLNALDLLFCKGRLGGGVGLVCVQKQLQTAFYHFPPQHVYMHETNRFA